MMTVIWQINDLNVSHREPFEVTKFETILVHHIWVQTQSTKINVSWLSGDRFVLLRTRGGESINDQILIEGPRQVSRRAEKDLCQTISISYGPNNKLIGIIVSRGR